MIDIVVVRDSGSRDGGDIFDVMLSEVAPALQRGRFEIDFNTPKVVHSIEVAYTPGLSVGDEVSLVDTYGAALYGVVKEYTHVREGVVLRTTVVVEVPQ